MYLNICTDLHIEIKKKNKVNIPREYCRSLILLIAIYTFFFVILHSLICLEYKGKKNKNNDVNFQLKYSSKQVHIHTCKHHIR